MLSYLQDNLYYKDDDFLLLLGDNISWLKSIKPKSVDLIFADPPYFLSNDGISCSGGKIVSVNKAEWDKTDFNISEKIDYYCQWISLCRNVLRDNGSIWISGTLHNIYAVGVALELSGFKILNNITWQKTNPPPNLSCRYFTHSTETILWARKDEKKSKHYYDYDLMKKMNSGKQMKDVWKGAVIKHSERKFGKYPTQKPEYLLERIILASSKKNDLILDPFNGSGTTGVVANKLERKYIGMDINKWGLDITIKRLKELKNNERF